ncbi:MULTISPECIES: glutathionylspermidine synthase family protein [Oceanimonas]|uniref:Glutathionylspermidine synthase family protein n=1 Tax=Oceanimonas smirnovii TaxID=264574 RepID=A0ABW7P0B4_9GAMM|nr:glutathionylspermidine synthase family protein [Oceanimonas sp. CAM02]MDV2858769.1 glutathionylspermidine synthase family protein [Oceanimonas sp. CAM02]
MLRVAHSERPHWRSLAEQLGFGFHTMYGEPYWDETAYYQFTLKQIEQDIEDPTAELHQMCLQVVDRVVRDEQLLRRCGIPEARWQEVADSWHRRDPSLYSRLDLAYNGRGPAKLYENNADTPTSLFETAFWQWLWLEDNVDAGRLRRDADQFNLLQERLVNRFRALAPDYAGQTLHFACCKDTEEDRGTVQYLEDCAKEARLNTAFVFVEDIGLGEGGWLTDSHDNTIDWLFKLYPWEFMFEEEYAEHLASSRVNWLEPMWKSVLSNKALLPLLWQQFPGHPNLLPAYFGDDPARFQLNEYVQKPLFSREGANIRIVRHGEVVAEVDGPYGEEGFIYQAWHPLPVFGGRHALVGSWLVDDAPAGIAMREDTSPITQDLSRYLPHIILG